MRRAQLLRATQDMRSSCTDVSDDVSCTRSGRGMRSTCQIWVEQQGGSVSGVY